METIKNLLSSGKTQDDEALRGEGHQSTHRGGLAGEGSHFGDTRNTTIGHTTGATDQHTSGLAGEGSHFGDSTHTSTGATSGTTAGLPGSTVGGVGSAGHGQKQYPIQQGVSSSTNPGATYQNTPGAFPQETAGPHNSNLANKAEPRVDSDGSNRQAGNVHSGTGLTGIGHFGSTNIGPHDSNLANQVDPRIDIDRDNSRTAGPGTMGSTTGYTGTNQGSSYHTGPTGSAVDGPHSTDTANRLDPAINTRGTSTENALHHSESHGGGAEEADHHHLGKGAAEGVGGTAVAGLAAHQYQQHQSDRSDARNISTIGQSQTTSHAASSGVSTSTVGQSQSTTGHQSSSTGSQYGAVGAGTSSGPAPNSFGPHKSDALNKLDPRVDAKTGTTSTSKNNSYDATGSHASFQSQHVDQHNTHHTGGGVALAGGATGFAYDAGKHQSSTDNSAPQSFTRQQQTGQHTTLPYRGTFSGHHGTGDAAGASGADAEREKWRNTQSLGEPGHPAITGISESTRPAPGSATDNHNGNTVAHADQPKDHHYARDAAVAGGVAGAGGAAYATGHRDPQHANTTAGPHSSNSANKADPAVDSDRAKGQQYGHDVATGGAVGTSTTHGANITAGPHSLNVANKADSTVDSDRSKEHHHGGDAAVVGGIAGGAGAAAFGVDQHNKDKRIKEAEKQARKDHEHDLKEQKKDHDKEVKAAAKAHDNDLKHAEKEHDNKIKHAEKAHEKEIKHAEKERQKELERREKEEGKEKKGGLFGFLHRDKDKKYTLEEEAELDRQEREHKSSTGRNAALGGAAVGVAGTAAYQAHDHNDPKHGDSIQKSENSSYHTEKKGGLLSFLHRDKSKKYTAEEEAEFDRQEREHTSHAGRNTALGGVAVGSGAYAAQQHHSHGADTNKTLPTTSGNQGTGTGTTGHHDKHTGPTPLVEKPLGKDIGDILHGVERNRGVQGPTGFPHDSEHSTTGVHSSKTGPTPLAEKPTGKDIGDKLHGVERNRGVQGATGFPHGNDSQATGHSSTGDSHLERNTAVGAGAAGIASHEHNKHESTTGYQSGLTDSGAHSSSTHHHDNTNSGITGSHRQYDDASGSRSDPLYTGRNPSILQASQDTESEYRKSEQTSAFTGTDTSKYDSSYSNSGTADDDTSGSTRRNKLHKDPPAGHPAAQAQSSSGEAHVPASSSKREELIGEGTKNLDTDTGVKNSHADGGVPRNY